MLTFEQVSLQLGLIPHNIPVPESACAIPNPRDVAKIKRARIVDLIKAGSCTAPEIATCMGIPYPTVKELLADMVDIGLLIRKEAPRPYGGKMFRYTVSAQGRQGGCDV